MRVLEITGIMVCIQQRIGSIPASRAQGPGAPLRSELPGHPYTGHVGLSAKGIRTAQARIVSYDLGRHHRDSNGFVDMALPSTLATIQSLLFLVILSPTDRDLETGV